MQLNNGAKTYLNATFSTTYKALKNEKDNVRRFFIINDTCVYYQKLELKQKAKEI